MPEHIQNFLTTCVKLARPITILSLQWSVHSAGCSSPDVDAEPFLQQYTTADTIGNGMDDGNNSPQSSLSSILYTLTIHALTRSAPVTIDGESSRPVPFPTRHQVMHVLGSTTLAEVRAACRVGGDSIPRAVESDASDEEERSSESNSEEDEDESDDARGGRRDSKRQRRESASNTKRPALGPAPPQKMPKWVDERRDTGHAFAIEGKIYADGRDTVLDYAE